jgi:tRNA(Ile)-lysidine synthase
MNTLIEHVAQLWPVACWADIETAIALSGGPDSVALLRAMVTLKGTHGGRGRLFALHVNHNLRGQESDGDQDFCEQLCREWNVPFRALTGKILERADAEGDGLESAARNERYDLLVEAAEQLGARFLVMAHNRDDQIETILFRLLRGTGLRGLMGIPFTRELTPSLAVVRPLLNCTRAEILEYLNLLGQPFREDASNADVSLARNRLRSELLPQLRSLYNPLVDEALLRLANQAGEHVDLCERLAEALLADTRADSPAGPDVVLQLRQDALQGQSSVVVREALRIAWRRAGLAEQAMTHVLWCQLAELASQPASTAILNLPTDLRAGGSNGLLFVERLRNGASC